MKNKLLNIFLSHIAAISEFGDFQPLHERNQSVLHKGAETIKCKVIAILSRMLEALNIEEIHMEQRGMNR